MVAQLARGWTSSRNATKYAAHPLSTSASHGCLRAASCGAPRRGQLLGAEAFKPAVVAAQPGGPLATQTIEDMEKDYCDDFVCTSSPAAERSIRSFARDLGKLRHSPTLMAKDVVYNGIRSFKGRAGYEHHTWMRDILANGKAAVEKMRMLEKGSVEVAWRLSGSVGALPLELKITTTLEFNAITGQISSQRDSIEVAQGGPLAAAAFASARGVWAAKQATRDASQSLSEVSQKITDSMSSMDESQGPSTNSNDPTKVSDGGSWSARRARCCLAPATQRARATINHLALPLNETDVTCTCAQDSHCFGSGEIHVCSVAPALFDPCDPPTPPQRHPAVPPRFAPTDLARRPPPPPPPKSQFFFNQDNNSQQNDLLTWATIIAFLYLAFRAYELILS